MRYLLAAIWVILFSFFACKEEKKLPNIIIVLADDLGYGDIRIYNPASKIPTPYLDQLARDGMRFTDAHTPSSVCTPTRYALLTGRYAWRTKLKSSVLWAWDKPLIEPDRLTLPKMLKSQDYATACIGKWHLGWRWPSRNSNSFMNDSVPIGNYALPGRKDLWNEIDFNKPLGGGPLEAGFDYYFGDDVPNFPPYTFFENDRLLQMPKLQKPQGMFGYPGPMAEGWKLENVMPTLTEKAVDYIHQQSKIDQPFFLYFALTAPHTPIAPIDKFRGRSEAGLYGDFVHEVDWSVGQIVKALHQSGQYENSLLIFTSDNGSPQRNGQGMSGPVGSVQHYGHNPSGPWRGLKADIWEGGHRVPFIVNYYGEIKTNNVNDHLICLTDIFSTLATLLGMDKYKEATEDSYDFSSLMLKDKSDQIKRKSIVHHSINGTFAIRVGEWKLILGKDSGGFSRGIPTAGVPVETEGQLYHLANDPGERENLYAQFPEKVKELTKKLMQIQQKSDMAVEVSSLNLK